LENHLHHYEKTRDYPAYESTSKLSPYLQFGEISPIEIWQATLAFKKSSDMPLHIDGFLSELLWREFANYLLFHYPNLYEDNLRESFNQVDWRMACSETSSDISAWQHGETGYPLIDAGMRELWQTGYMHNRVRMLTASFLVKNLMLHWHIGRDWFWDCLVDASLANNSVNWQWVAGTGVDAAPYFRVFNPTLQAKKFDIKGDYIVEYLPILSKLPRQYLFEPWLAPKAALKKAGIILGKHYPMPIVDFHDSRKKALLLYRKAK
jgi:deoxyribodipyrimidine photo-lyase